MKRYSHPLLTRFLLFVALPLFVLLAITIVYLKRSLPQIEGEYYSEAVNQEVLISRDQNGIPHILAKTDYDAFFAMGYVHAQDRLWQMEYRRRMGQGRLSEVVGVSALQTDKFMRTLGLYRQSKHAFHQLDSETRDSLIAYAAGVNAWIDSVPTLPIEFKILNVKPEPWKPEDSLLQGKLMALELAQNFGDEILHRLLVHEMGTAKASDLFPIHPQDAVTITAVTHAKDQDLQAGLLRLYDNFENVLGLGSIGIGSNAWVVSGNHTVSGKPLLANDPHLANQIPSSLYLAELKGKDIYAVGASFPGVPYIIFGHNEEIAWGATNLMADVQDLYVERLNPFDSNQYEFEGKWIDMEVREELIHIKPELPEMLATPLPPLVWNVRRTRNGPVISDAIENSPATLSLRWTALAERDSSFEALRLINYADDWKSFEGAASRYVGPGLNYLYADKRGNVGYLAAGRIPLRKTGNGTLPAPGWVSDYDWIGYIPFSQMPRSFNPESGVIVNANNKNHDDSYPYHISSSWAPPYRAERIQDMIYTRIRSGHKLNVEQFKEIQGDEVSLQARELIPYFSSLNPEESEHKDIVDELQSWDGRVSKSSSAAAIYQAWIRNFSRRVISDDIRGNLLFEARGNMLQALLERQYPKFIHGLLMQQNANSNEWCDSSLTEQYETCADMALKALDDAIVEIKRLSGSGAHWGEVYKAHYPHSVFGNVPLLDTIFNREISAGGDAYSINVGQWSYSKDKGYLQTVNPSYRQVIDTADWDNSGYILSTGQSGNILSKHYDDLINKHRESSLLPMTFGSGNTTNIESVLVLKPTS